MHRKWREVGEQPGLWESFPLKVCANMVDEDQDQQQQLLQVLSLKRFQSLQHLSLHVVAETWVDKMMLPVVLGINNGSSVWVDSANLLHTVRENHPAIKKLSLKFTTDGSEDKIAQLAQELVMFEEIDLVKCKFGSAGFSDSDANDSTAAVLRALLAASADPISKMKILTICDVDAKKFLGIQIWDRLRILGKACFKSLYKTCSEALAEAKGRLTVKIVDKSYSDDEDDSYDGDSYDDDDDDDSSDVSYL